MVDGDTVWRGQSKASSAWLVLWCLWSLNLKCCVAYLCLLFHGSTLDDIPYCFPRTRSVFFRLCSWLGDASVQRTSTIHSILMQEAIQTPGNQKHQNPPNKLVTAWALRPPGGDNGSSVPSPDLLMHCRAPGLSYSFARTWKWRETIHVLSLCQKKCFSFHPVLVNKRHRTMRASDDQ